MTEPDAARIRLFFSVQNTTKLEFALEKTGNKLDKAKESR